MSNDFKVGDTVRIEAGPGLTVGIGYEGKTATIKARHNANDDYWLLTVHDPPLDHNGESRGDGGGWHYANLVYQDPERVEAEEREAIESIKRALRGS